MKYARKELLPYVSLTALQTDKFKTGYLSISLLAQLSAETAAENAILPYILRRGTKSLPDMKAISARLDELYGASIEPCVRKWGEVQSFGFRAGFCEDRFLPGDTHVLEDVTRLLGELLLSPNTRGGLFLPAYVDSEKAQMTDRIEARKNDKRSYARRRMEEEMCAFEDFAIDVLGRVDDVEEIRYVTLSKRYKEILSQCPVEIFYCGSRPADEVAAALKDALLTLPRGDIDLDMGTDIRMNSVEDEPRVFDETMDVSQGNLVLGYRLGSCMEEPDVPALRVFNSILGGGMNSKLFTHVREERSLCYSVGSLLHLHKGIMEIYAGIDGAKYDEALTAIREQTEAMARGDITEEELSQAKNSLVGLFRAVTDDPAALESFWQGQAILGLDCGPEELSVLVEEVTAEQVQDIARGIVLDAIYFLHGKEAEA